jgi:hypothetical protein
MIGDGEVPTAWTFVSAREGEDIVGFNGVDRRQI